MKIKKEGLKLESTQIFPVFGTTTISKDIAVCTLFSAPSLLSQKKERNSYSKSANIF